MKKNFEISVLSNLGSEIQHISFDLDMDDSSDVQLFLSKAICLLDDDVLAGVSSDSISVVLLTPDLCVFSLFVDSSGDCEWRYQAGNRHICEMICGMYADDDSLYIV